MSGQRIAELRDSGCWITRAAEEAALSIVADLPMRIAIFAGRDEHGDTGGIRLITAEEPYKTYALVEIDADGNVVRGSVTRDDYYHEEPLSEPSDVGRFFAAAVSGAGKEQP